MECVLDLANHFIADASLAAPETNQDTFLRLEQAGAMAPELAARLRAWAGSRNIPVHQYLDIDHRIAWNAIQNELGDVDAFADWAVRQLTCPPGVGALLSPSCLGEVRRAIFLLTLDRGPL